MKKQSGGKFYMPVYDEWDLKHPDYCKALGRGPKKLAEYYVEYQKEDQGFIVTYVEFNGNDVTDAVNEGGMYREEIYAAVDNNIASYEPYQDQDNYDNLAQAV